MKPVFILILALFLPFFGNLPAIHADSIVLERMQRDCASLIASVKDPGRSPGISLQEIRSVLEITPVRPTDPRALTGPSLISSNGRDATIVPLPPTVDTDRIYAAQHCAISLITAFGDQGTELLPALIDLAQRAATPTTLRVDAERVIRSLLATSYSRMRDDVLSRTLQLAMKYPATIGYQILALLPPERAMQSVLDHYTTVSDTERPLLETIARWLDTTGSLLERHILSGKATMPLQCLPHLNLMRSLSCPTRTAINFLWDITRSDLPCSSQAYQILSEHSNAINSARYDCRANVHAAQATDLIQILAPYPRNSPKRASVPLNEVVTSLKLLNPVLAGRRVPHVLHNARRVLEDSSIGDEARTVARTTLKLLGREALPTIFALLQQPAVPLRSHLAALIAHHENLRLADVRPCISLLQDKEPYIRYSCFQALRPLSRSVARSLQSRVQVKGVENEFVILLLAQSGYLDREVTERLQSALPLWSCNTLDAFQGLSPSPSLRTALITRIMSCLQHTPSAVAEGLESAIALDLVKELPADTLATSLSRLADDPSRLLEVLPHLPPPIIQGQLQLFTSLLGLTTLSTEERCKLITVAPKVMSAQAFADLLLSGEPSSYSCLASLPWPALDDVLIQKAENNLPRSREQIIRLISYRAPQCHSCLPILAKASTTESPQIQYEAIVGLIRLGRGVELTRLLRQITELRMDLQLMNETLSPEAQDKLRSILHQLPAGPSRTTATHLLRTTLSS